jgi:hypothetical protein
MPPQGDTMPFNRASPVTIWTIAGGVLIGTLGAHVIELTGAALLVRIELAKVSYELDKAAKHQRQEAERQRLTIERQNAERANVQHMIQEQERANREAMAQAERDLETARAKKAKAWAAFYAPPKKCTDNPNDQTFMSCANEHARAMIAFEKQYKP